MDKRYEAYCLTDPLFYDHPAARQDTAAVFEHVRRPVPDGWSAAETGDWRHLLPAEHALPDQGWKIHVSATPDSAGAVLDAVWEHCVAAGLAFKFLSSPTALFLRNSKYAERGSSGKFATVYPADEDELERTLKQLDDVLAGQPGPYILSDLRYAAGPLYLRYGAFTARRCQDESGESVPAIADPTGRLVPDRRGPAFAPPPWVRLPDFLAPHLQARGADSLADLPYTIEKALHFSNGGGVYQGTDKRNGRKVVLKEARPHAGLIGDGRDAVARLEREREVLRLVAGSGAGPEVLDWFELGEHRFLVLEFVEGRTLNTVFGERFPLIGRAPDPAVLRAYTAWALGIQVKVEKAVAALHERGVVFNDLHLFNIMVRPDDSVTLIDFEVAAPLAQAGRQLLAARGFAAPRGVTGPAVDDYALACLRLALFLPLTGLLPLDRGRARALADAIRGEFPGIPSEFLDEAVRRIGAAEPAGQRTPAGVPARAVDAPITGGDWPRARSAMSAAIAAMASPERADRLFPGDIRQFAHPGAGLGIAHGAAGVLYALHAAGAQVPAEYEHWLLRRAAEPPRDIRLGFYDGVHGIAYVLDLLGHRDAALRLVDLALAERWQRLGPDLTEGLAGVGLNLLHFAGRVGDRGLYGAAIEAGRLATELLAQQDAARAGGGRGTRVSGPAGRAGLLRGASGPALLFLHLYEHTGEQDWLVRARSALRMDLACCTISDRDGSMRVNEGWRALPYLGEGGAGIGFVLRRYLTHRDDEGLRAAARAVRRASASRFYAQSGLFSGRAGLALALADERDWSAARVAAGEQPGLEHAAEDDAGALALDQARRLAWHAVGYRGGLAFPGDQLHRLSADLATGGAGVLLAVGAVHGEPGARLPFLGPRAAA
ncbi:class III lanthionine synthetase LanKC [Actinospica sp.]|uniref:class III lanthionine synthetase LanKC n=1 Tax=Actinospica sp. TaxID=1872142 RepID=UPI002CADBBDB|nr:class III lanthionine synthetase LanKC [Actinospica sp.]HWG26264.1 class III lanthionine synthetase LanKC [Actinospica sp.]